MLILNANTQQEEEITWSVDANREIICTFEDGTFLKFPAGTSEEELVALLEAHHEQNFGNEVITPEMEAEMAAEAAAAEELVAKLNGNTMLTGAKTNGPSYDSFS